MSCLTDGWPHFPGSPDNPRSPIGQWTLAIRAENEVRRRSPEGFIGSHELYGRLAACYQRTGNETAALEAWLTSAERAIALEDVNNGARALKTSEGLPADAAQAARRQGLFGKLKELQQPVQR